MSREADRAARPHHERSKLRRELGRLDAVCLLIAAIVVLDTLGAVARGGAQTVLWLMLVSAFFFIPAGLVISELGTAFPHEGGPYVWARMAFGRLAGSLVALIYWIETPVWVGGSLAITAIAVVDELIVPVDGLWRPAFALSFVWLTIALALVPLRIAKWIPAAGAIVQVLLLTLFTATVAVYAAEHGVHGIESGDLAPSWGVFILAAPVLVYNFIGFELPSTAAEELRDPQRDIPAAIARAGALTTILYCVPIVAIVLVLPPGRITSLTGFIDALGSVFVVYGGASGALEALAAAAFVLVLFANGLTWLMGSSRTQVAASLDGAAPRSLGAISARTGTPVRATLVAGAVSTLTAAAAFAVAGDSDAKYFSVVLTLSIALLALASLPVFAALVRLRTSHAGVHRPFRVPGGRPGAWAASVLATGWCALAFAAILWPGLGTADPDASLPAGFAGDRAGFVAVELVPIAAVLVGAAIFAGLGRRGERRAAQAAPA
jgi:glutamate:GABA antiporter